MYRTCNCTLAGTKACENCENNSYFTSPFLTTLIVWDDVLENHNLQIYNPETHDLVEKKEAKIKRLEDELQVELTKAGECTKVIKEFTAQVKEVRSNIEKLSSELEELKSDLSISKG